MAEGSIDTPDLRFPPGSFLTPRQEGVEEVLHVVSRALHLTFHALREEVEVGVHEVKRLKVGMYQRYYGGNMDEGWTRWLLEQFEFEYSTVRDKEIKEGKIAEKYDLLILPSDATPMITGEKLEEYFEKRFRGRFTLPKYPPEYRSGIGKEGVEKIKEFVESGGTLVTLNEASNFAIEELKLPISNVVKDLNPKDFFCPGSTLKVKVDEASPLAYGIPQDCLILFRNSPVFAVKPGEKNEDYRVVVSYPEERILQSGWLIGEKYLSRKAALIEARMGKGRVILFGFSPQFRAQTHGTFKFLFNALIT